MEERIIQEQYDQCEDLTVLVRLLKHFNQRVGELPPAKHVNSFVFEAMVAILFDNGTIPLRFNMSRAFCTCIEYIAFPEDIWASCAVPTEEELVDMRSNCGETGLIIVDPVAPFKNIADRTNRTNRAWKLLTKKASKLYNSLTANGVLPY